MKIGFVGLGNMGFPMASQLLKHSYDIYAYDPVVSAAEKFYTIKGKIVKNILEIAEIADVVISMVPAEQHLFEIYTDDFIQMLKPNALCIDCSTVGPMASRKWHDKLHQAGIQSLDAPVSGGVAAASNGTLTFMVGGDEENMAKAKPILSAMGNHIIYSGDKGLGQAAKICNNLILANTMIAVSEGFKLAKAFGLPFDKLHEITSSSSAKSWIIDNYLPVPNVLENVPANRDYKPGFSCQMMFKDLSIIEQTAKDLEILLELTHKSFEIYQNIIANQQGDKDFSYVYACQLPRPSGRGL